MTLRNPSEVTRRWWRDERHGGRLRAISG